MQPYFYGRVPLRYGAQPYSICVRSLLGSQCIIGSQCVIFFSCGSDFDEVVSNHKCYVAPPNPLSNMPYWRSRIMRTKDECIVCKVMTPVEPSAVLPMHHPSLCARSDVPIFVLKTRGRN